MAACNLMLRDDSFLTRYIVYILFIILLLGSVIVFWISYQRNQLINEEIAVYEASQFVNSIARFRTFYSEQFVPIAQANGLKITHDYHSSADALPLPATMIMDFAKYLEQSKDNNYHVRLYSDQPFPWRKDGGVKDDFESWALQKLRDNPDKAVWRFESKAGQQILRYARADRLGESCVNCHNTYPGTPKKDWKVGDVRGVLEVSRPLSGFEQAMEKAMAQSFFMLLALGVILLVILMLALRSLRSSLHTSQSSVAAARLANQKLLQGIQEREQLAEDLKASQIKARTIVDSVIDAIIVINSKGIIIETNKSVYAILGYTPDELLGQNINVLMDGVHHQLHGDYIKTYLKTGEQQIIGKPRQLCAKRKGGSLFPIDLSINEARFGDNIVFTGIIRDISHRIQTQQALAQARDAALESARLKSEFLANMSHEIRTPMNGIIGMVDLLLEGKLNREQREQVRTIQHSADSLLRIINDILDFSKIEAGKLTITNSSTKLLPLLESVVDLLAENASSKGLEVAFFVDKNVPSFIGTDAVRLRQILLNLLNNAIKFTERGHVILRVSLSSTPQDKNEKCLLRFEILDTGCGIPEEAQSKLFTAFSQVDGSVTRQHGGTGLGLAICKQLAQLMGGDVGLVSQVAVGSTFWATIMAEVKTNERLFDFKQTRSLLVLGTRPALNQYYEKQFRDWGLKSIVVDSLNSLVMVLEKINGFDFIMLDADIAYHKPEHPLGMVAVVKAIREHNQAPLYIYGSARQIMLLEAVSLGRHINLITKPLKYSSFLTQMSPPRVLEPELILEPLTPLVPLAEAVSSSLESLRILLTEDHIVNQRVALAMLRKMGVGNVDCALNGEEAIQAVQHQHYDLVLMDCQMPVMDGYEATRRIRQLDNGVYRDLPIVALTAHAMKGDDEKCYEAGMNDYLSKPVRLEELQQKLEKWLKVKTSVGE